MVTGPGAVVSQVRARPPKPKTVTPASVMETAAAVAETIEIRYLFGAAAGLVAAWLAAGSTGLLGHPLRHVLTWIAVIVTLLAAWPSESRSGRRMVSIAGL